MKLHVMYNTKGKIVAAVRIDADGKAKHDQIGHPRPVVKPGHFSADLEVPAEHAHLGFADACRQLVVETGGDKPHLKLGSAKKS